MKSEDELTSFMGGRMGLLKGERNEARVGV